MVKILTIGPFGGAESGQEAVSLQFPEEKNVWDGPHPRPKSRVDLSLSLDHVKEVFAGCADFETRPLHIKGAQEAGTLCWVNGMVKTERVNDYILRPLSQWEGPDERSSVFQRILEGWAWTMTVQERTDMDDVTGDLVNGCCILFLPGEENALSFQVQTEEKRAVSAPEIENVMKGPKDSFTESVRTNTSLVRRRIRTPWLRVEEQIVGRQSMTPVDVMFIQGLTDPELVAQIQQRIADIDIDALISTGNLEEYVIDNKATSFPQVLFTERPDRFCNGLMDGRVGVLIDGLPMACLLPGDIALFLKAPQDRSNNYAIGTVLTIIRYLCMAITLLAPGFYVAVATFHPEMIPTKLALSIISSKQDVPFSTIFEVLTMLVAFEILQEAGLRLPKTIGQTVSIIGGLVVGQSAVEAKIVSPVVVIVVAIAGIAGYTMPNQDFASALRIWRFFITAAAGVAGLFGLMVCAVALVYRLAEIESFGVAYLSPFAPATGNHPRGHTIIRPPLPMEKFRDMTLHPRNSRKQK